MKLPRTLTPTRVHAVEETRAETVKKFWTLLDISLDLLIPSHLLSWNDDDVSRDKNPK